MRKIGDKKISSALPFDQPGDFFYRRAMKFAQKDEYEKAVFNIRKAIQKDEKNIGYKLDLAGLLTEIEHFDDSNELLFSILINQKQNSAECYFGLGCNFYGLNDFKKATSSLSKYLNLSPDGEYAEDAEIMLENIEFDSTIFPPDSSASPDAPSIKEATDFTDSDLQKGDNDLFAMNNLAVSYILENKLDKAQEVCKKILKQEPLNIHALCNMAMIKNRIGDKNVALTYAFTALDQEEYEYSDLLKVSVALCDLGMHEEAVDVFYELLDDNPYDLHTRHFLAVALFNCGEYEQALAQYKFIEKFKPESSVNNWYINTVRDKIDGKNDIESFPYLNQVSADCVYSRINKINEMIKGKDALLWENHEFRELVLWAFDIKDDTLKSSMVSLIAKYANDEAAPILREKLCSRHVSDEIKHRILMSLKKLGEDEPYLALIDNNIVEVSVNTFEVNATKYLSLQKDIIELILDNMPSQYDIDYFKFIINTWNSIIEKSKAFDTIDDCHLWAAALEHRYSSSQNRPFDPQEISVRFDVDFNDMLNLSETISQILKEQ